jgi:mycothiol synthase
METAVVELAELAAPDRSSLGALLERAAAAHDHPALPEPQLLALTQAGGTPHDGRLVLVRNGAELAGCAVLSPARDGSTVLHVVVDPAVTTTLESALIRLAVQEAPAGFAVHLWLMQATAADDDRAKAEGFVPERDLLQMRVALPLPDDVLAATRPLVTRRFVPGHPEQGAWTVAELQERMAADWVDLDGFLIADDPDGPGLIGACWTKIHRDRTPPLGEIYVIDVDPRHHGQGWGRSLTVAGLVYLARAGIAVGMLYTDASNVAAVALYRSLGFMVDHVDRSYRRDPPGAPLS